jgi:PAS domain S-box-containing protein
VEVYSPQCKALYGYSDQDLPNLPEALDELTHPDDAGRMRQARDDHFAGRTPAYVNEHRVRCKNGQWKWILSRGIVISRDAAGRPLRMIGTHTDLTAAKQAEALRLERDRAAAADQAKSQFLSRVSHELRTPLNAILGFAQLLDLDPGATERQRGWIGHVLSSGKHLLALMDDILDISSVQTGQLPTMPEHLSLRVVVEEAWAMLDTAARQAGIEVIDEVPPGDALAVRADRRRLKQIVSNLLSNAIKYNRPGGWVRLRAKAAGDLVELSVADSGPGLSEAERARLFTPFERLGAKHGPVAGTGLGLALSRQLAEAMGGSIEVESEPGQGATFRVRLPAG